MGRYAGLIDDTRAKAPVVLVLEELHWGKWILMDSSSMSI